MEQDLDYTAAIVIIGNEILSGRTQDTNTAYIAQKLVARGITLGEVRVIPDIGGKIIETVNTLRGMYSYVFTTGGIGPTHDDITAENIAKAFGVALPANEEAMQILRDYYGPENLTQARARMARIPEGAALIPNPVSGAPGFRMDNVYVFAGVPKIMQAMLDHVLPSLHQGAPVESVSVSCQIPESVMADDVGALQERYLGCIDVGSYPQFLPVAGGVGLSIVLRSVDKEALRKAAQELVVCIRTRGIDPQVTFSFDE